MTQPTAAVPPSFSTVAIVGVGLIGGSIALAIKQHGGPRTVIGVGRSGQRLAEARLGTRFEEREFDRTVLEGGALSLDLVELQVEEFLKTRPAQIP